MRALPLTTAVPWLLFMGAALTQVQLQRVLDGRVALRPPQPPEVPDPLGALARGGLRRRVAADLLYIRAMTYAGDEDFHAEQHSRLPALAKVVLDLDPSWADATFMLALALSTQPATVPAALDVFALGGARFPDQWRFPFVEGAVAYFDANQPDRAAASWQRASRFPNVPSFVGALAVRLTAGTCHDALASVVELSRQGPPDARALFADRARNLQWECSMQDLEAAVDAYVARHGTPPPDGIPGLIRDGLLPGVPPDPFGGSFTVDRHGKVTSSTLLMRIAVGRARTRPPVAPPAQEAP